ncbi:hypothetical protein ACJIZ3_004181 [Penstemon smallii]|uniref:Replication factor A C-terminal domain-containing protein n=1 Tax=Penstemon smallii TaxID=265156 RepID=A0ABD3S1I4_9LAMI
MTTQMLHIVNVNKDTKLWAVRVMVEAKTQPWFPARGTKRYQRILLVDETGQKISATIFDPDIEKFKAMFCLYKTYTVSNATVSKIEDKYDKFGYPYQWIINSKTACNPDPEFGLPKSLVKTEYTSIIDLKSLVGQKVLIDVAAIVIQKGELRSFILNNKDAKLREFAILNQEKKVVALTLWNAVAVAEGELIDNCTDTMPIIRATQLMISSHRDGSLGSTASTVVEIDPQIPEVHALKVWRSANLRFIVDAITAKDYLPRIESSAPFLTDHITTIADVLSAEKMDRFTVEVNALVTHSEQKYYYMACGKCFSAVDAAYEYEYTCAMCGQMTKAKPRERIHVSIYDTTGSLDVTIFGPPVIMIMQMDAEMCLKIFSAGDEVTAGWINGKLFGKTFYMNVKRKDIQVGGVPKQQYTVTNLQIKESEEVTNLVDENKPDKMTNAPVEKSFDHSSSALAKDIEPGIFDSSAEVVYDILASD